jgi:hypothetical protein
MKRNYAPAFLKLVIGMTRPHLTGLSLEQSSRISMLKMKDLESPR